MALRVRGMSLLVFLTMVATSFAGGHASAANAAPRLMFSGHGYATYVGGGGVAPQKTANVVMWCHTKPGQHHSNSVASVSVPPALTAGEAVAKVDGVTTSAGKKASSETDVHNISLIGGLVTADQLKAVSTTLRQGRNFVLSDAGAVWSNITVAGQPIPSQVPAPNTRFDIPAVGYVILNEQLKQTAPTKAVFTVNMLHLFVTMDNPLLGVKKGLNVIVGHALSGLVEVAGPLGGKAYTSQLTAAGALSTGPSAVMYLPCAGTDGKVKTNTLGGIGIPSLLGIGSGKNTGSGTVTPTRVKGTVESTAQNIRLLGGMITADAIDAHVLATKLPGAHRKLTDASTGLVHP